VARSLSVVSESEMAPKVNLELAAKRSTDKRLLHYDVDAR
jgi:hypothetical protein